MDTQHAIDLTREALRMSVMLAGLPLVAALLVGLVVGALQTITQMHEAVVAQLPRLAAIVAVVFLILPWLVSTWVDYARTLIASLA